MGAKTDRLFADSPGGERRTIGGVEEGAGRDILGMMRQQAEAVSRIHQEVHGRDGVPQEKQFATGELSS